MKWDFEIDRVITTLLINSKEPRYDSDIFEHLKKSSKKQISPTTYTAHKEKLIYSDIIEKIEVDKENRGKIKYDMTEVAKERHRPGVKYCMTEKAKERHRLGILLFNTTDEISFGSSQTQEEKQLKVFFYFYFALHVTICTLDMNSCERTVSTHFEDLTSQRSWMNHADWCFLMMSFLEVRSKNL